MSSERSSAPVASPRREHGTHHPRATARTGLARVAVLGTHLPRRCGIATFTADLREAMAATHPAIDCLVVAMDDAVALPPYPPSVRRSIAASDPAAYRRAADYLNAAAVDVVALQHEYGIFGGDAGALLLPLLDALRMPVVTTLHTVLAAPSVAQRAVLDAVLRRSARVVVMSGQAAALLRHGHDVAADRIDVIPHGIPTAVYDGGTGPPPGLAGRRVLLTFGLLSPDKGIEYVIDALPAIAAVDPTVLYLVVGATHPHVLAAGGEQYRHMLEARARRHGVASHLRFIDRFVEVEEIGAYLHAADIYLTPYLNVEQSTSGTLAFALGAGRAMVSTPYRYAVDVLADGRGVLVPCRDAAAIAQAVTSLFGDPDGAAAMRRRAAALGATMHWGEVARGHVASLTRALAQPGRPGVTSAAGPPAASGRPAPLPPLALTHLLALTDDTAVLQHAHHSVPRYRDGYCLDDTARAALLVARLDEAGLMERGLAQRLGARYLAFVAHAYVPARGRFRNLMRFTRRWGERIGSDDCQGRAAWALGTVLARATTPGHRQLAAELFPHAIAAAAASGSPRAWAYALLGLDEALRATKGTEALARCRATLAERLTARWRATATADWPWFEPHATYANARLPQALLLAGIATGRDDQVTIALRALTWLHEVQTSAAGDFAPIGSNGFYPRGTPAAAFDQQPIEACGMIAAAAAAARVTGDPAWSRAAESAFRWFLGANHLGVALADATTGGCRDGLHQDRVNENQGAESTISWLQALADLHALRRTGPA
jgi:glycosyltransferase involved in cell wall biosynthesis